MPPPPDNGEELSSVELQLSVLPAEYETVASTRLERERIPLPIKGRRSAAAASARSSRRCGCPGAFVLWPRIGAAETRGAIWFLAGSGCQQLAERTLSFVAFGASAELLAVKQIFIQEELDQGNDVSSISLQRVQSLEQIEREVEILRLLQHHDHPNVDFGAFDESMMRCYLRGVVCGMAHLHALGIAHRDLKCANLLLADDERGGVKIADFGTAKRASVSFMEGYADGNAMETAR
ncbi:hypothetical protein BBJ28_00004946 [Nothophytophthora sp. Chile5]|nr:hypothetical protein BBJ28_00004946 [Nothophytophthora sp. Chile5]